jgi:hypothetical protein
MKKEILTLISGMDKNNYGKEKFLTKESLYADMSKHYFMEHIIYSKERS